ncbi:MAG: hypothetical protein KDK55_00125 [Chlamydiia bacterium]|nr:hypothetical protein [Chlamydiia bacterium]
MNKKSLLTKCFFLALFLISPIFANDSFHLNLPKEWKKISDASQLPNKVVALYVGKKRGQFTPSVNLARETTELDGAAYAKLAKNYHENLPDTTCRPLGHIEIAENVTNLLQIDKETAWGGLRFLQATLVSNGTAYVITATAQVSEYASLYPLFYEAIKTFHPPTSSDKQ